MKKNTILDYFGLLEENERMAEVVRRLSERNRHLETRLNELITEGVAEETAWLQKRIEALTEANHEAALRIRELEEAKTVEIHREDAEPNRYDMIAMCREKEWWLGNDVLTDEEETLRYPWIDYRDYSRLVTRNLFFQWLKERKLNLQREYQREQYHENEEYRQKRLASARKSKEKRREKLKQSVSTTETK